MPNAATVKVLFIAGFGPIIRNSETSGDLYREALGIHFKEETDGYFHTEAVPGAKGFALWPLSQVAQSCFGRDSWPTDIPVPQAWLEFDVDNIEGATAALESKGLSNAHQEQERAVGPNCQPLHLPGGIAGGNHVYSGTARTEVGTSDTRAAYRRFRVQQTW